MNQIELGKTYFNEYQMAIIPVEFVDYGRAWVRFIQLDYDVTGQAIKYERLFPADEFVSLCHTSNRLAQSVTKEHKAQPVSRSVTHSKKGVCVVCGKQCSGRAKTCGAKCRKQLSRTKSTF